METIGNLINAVNINSVYIFDTSYKEKRFNWLAIIQI